jgi:uncharacterized protein (DUF697 family)
MTEKQKKDCKKIINVASASAAAVGGGLAQIPGSDSVPLALTMTISLGKVFGKSLTESSAKAAMGSALASQVGRTISQIAIGWWPGIGNVINGATAAAVTEALGWALAKEFDEGLL